jgi:hypothetical protein
LLAGCAYPQTDGEENDVFSDNKSAVAVGHYDTAIPGILKMLTK